jgi:hypothetical protein
LRAAGKGNNGEHPAGKGTRADVADQKPQYISGESLSDVGQTVLHAAVWARALEAVKLLLVKADGLIYKVKQAVAPSCLCTTPALRLWHTHTNS